MSTSTITAVDPSTDRIEEQARLKQSPERVWRALTNPEELGTWFGAKLDARTIRPGDNVRGQVTHPGYEHVPMDLIIEEMVPERRFSWRWHPHNTEKGVDYSNEPRTLVEFILEPTPDGGTLLRVVESGFSALPAARRAIAFPGNTNGWKGQLQKRLPKYLDG